MSNTASEMWHLIACRSCKVLPRRPRFSSARLTRYGITSGTGPKGRYLLTLKPACANDSDITSAIPFNCAKCKRGFCLDNPTSRALAAAFRPESSVIRECNSQQFILFLNRPQVVHSTSCITMKQSVTIPQTCLINQAEPDYGDEEITGNTQHTGKEVSTEIYLITYAVNKIFSERTYQIPCCEWQAPVPHPHSLLALACMQRKNRSNGASPQYWNELEKGPA